MLDRFFGPEAKARIEAAVCEAEARSLGQIVPVVVEKSDGYPEARHRGALLGAGLATVLVLALRLPLTLAELPLVQLAAGALGALLALWDPVERVLAGRTELELAARDRAVRAFHEHGLHRTEQGTGVLLFASLFERRAVVLGDRGIHAKMGDAEWQRTVDALVAGMRRGDPAGGFCEAIALCGAKLAEHFPRAPGAPAAPNELADALRTSKT
ncbi:MAG TPA: TPM domain-containing protein [Anaeromyxobacteraceae bacterium]|nr:TPM domain-containing protein [Anaeromyxobacteraceae bacterium]